MVGGKTYEHGVDSTPDKASDGTANDNVVRVITLYKFCSLSR